MNVIDALIEPKEFRSNGIWELQELRFDLRLRVSFFKMRLWLDFDKPTETYLRRRIRDWTKVSLEITNDFEVFWTIKWFIATGLRA